jgi:hypothetical protein
LLKELLYPVNNIYLGNRIAAKMQEYLESSTWPSAAARWFRSISTVYLEWPRVSVPCGGTWKVSLEYKSFAETPWVETPILEISLSWPLSEEMFQEQHKAILHEGKETGVILFP